jgi:CheY-like chemotaxis protein
MKNNFLLHILLIDDDEDDKELFIQAFKDVAPESVVSTATSCDELVENIDSLNNNELPDIIFLDLNMPKMDGFECLDLLKSINPLNNIPVFIYSTSVNPVHIEITYQKGASRFFQKPGTFDGIKQLINFMLSLPTESYLPQTSWEDFMVKSPHLVENQLDRHNI